MGNGFGPMILSGGGEVGIFHVHSRHKIMENSPERGEPKAAMACRLCGGEPPLYGRQEVLGK
jgi:hypothetical protein